MGIPFRNGEELASALGYGELYKKAEENEAQGEMKAESIKKLMKRIEECR